MLVGPKLNFVNFKQLWWTLFIKRWSSSHHMYAGKRYNGYSHHCFGSHSLKSAELELVILTAQMAVKIAIEKYSMKKILKVY